MSLPAGTMLGRYELLSLLGAGGMGEVYRGHDARLDRDVAVKVISSEGASDPERQRRFEQEARAAGALSHPNVCTIYDAGAHEGMPYVVMELLEGESLRERLLRGPLTVPATLELGAQAAEALIVAHGAGIVHRDLKPANLFVTTRGELKILDFGLAKLTAVTNRADAAATTLTDAHTRAGTILGTVAYMAPEQVRAETVDTRADVFSLGVVLFEMLTGRLPFDGAGTIETMHAILHDDPALLRDLRPDAPAHLGRILLHCLARDPERRIQTAIDVRNEIDGLRRELEQDRSERQSTVRSSDGLVERQLILRAPTVRELSDRLPRLVGYPMNWLDNQVESEALIVFVWGGTGGDATAFEGVLRAVPHRAVAPTLVGFGRGETYRPPLGLEDHSRLLRFFLRSVVDELRPKRTFLVGFSASADHLLRMNHDEAAGGLGVPVDGLLVLGSNVSLETCFVTRVYSRLDAADPHQVLATLRMLSADIESLPAWLVVQQYIAHTFLKLGTDLAPLKRFAADLLAPYEQEVEPFAAWYRTARRRIPNLRLVYSEQEAGPLEALLARHLESNVLGDELDERDFVVEPVHHFELLRPSLLLGYVESLTSEAMSTTRRSSA